MSPMLINSPPFLGARPEEPGLIDELNASRNLDFYAKIHGIKSPERDEKVGHRLRRIKGQGAYTTHTPRYPRGRWEVTPSAGNMAAQYVVGAPPRVNGLVLWASCLRKRPIGARARGQPRPVWVVLAPAG